MKVTYELGCSERTTSEFIGVSDAAPGVFTGRKLLPLLAFVVLLVFQTPQPVFADNVQTTQDTLLDRIQIEDLISNYYWDIASGRHELSEYYIEDGILDVNGIIYTGREAILGAYTQGESESPSRKIHMLLNNPRIRVNGDTATAETIWTGVILESVRLAPRLFEQGREYDELVKKDGRWYFKKRVITSDAGLTEMYDETYQER
jgi:hypothetical protein